MPNANGAGDTFCAGFLAAALWERPRLTLQQAGQCAALAALHRVDSALRAAPSQVPMAELVRCVVSGEAADLEVI